MIEVGIGDMYGNASYRKEQNVLPLSLIPLRYIRDRGSSFRGTLKELPQIIYENYLLVKRQVC